MGKKNGLSKVSRIQRMSRAFRRSSLPAVFALAVLGQGGSVDAAPRDLTELSLEALMNLEVTSVSKKEEPVSHAAAAVFVLTAEDLRRAGVSSIPEALRLVPGLNVARIDSSRWAITARGFNGLFADKLLVLIDGRTVYTPLFSGVNWDVQDTVIEDVERIEVIRGPGASLWGANAMNGVINIITKRATETTGGLVSVAAGSEERAVNVLRYGERFSEETAGRFYLKYTNRDDSERTDFERNNDAWEMWRGGTRVDWESGEDRLLFELEAYGGEQDARAALPIYVPPFSETVDDTGYAAGGFALVRWNRTLDESSDFAFQLYYDKTDRDNFILRQIHDTIDLDSQLRLGVSERSEVMLGINYRHITDDLRSRRTVFFDPGSRDLDIFSGFIQHEYQVVPSIFRVIVGTKLEHNEYTGLEIQPTARAVWTPSDRHTLWAAISRATRTPSRADSDLNPLVTAIFPDPESGLPTEVGIFGSDDLGSEDLLAYEVGHRFALHRSFSIDTALFFNHYENLSAYERGAPALVSRPFPVISVPLRNADTLSADAFGGEIVLDTVPHSSWRLQAGYAYVGISTFFEELTPALSPNDIDGSSPQNQVFLRSILDLPYNLEFDSFFRYVDNVPGQDNPAYSELGVRLGWRYSKNLEFSIQGDNLLHASHREYRANFVSAQPARIERSFLGRVTWRF